MYSNAFGTNGQSAGCSRHNYNECDPRFVADVKQRQAIPQNSAMPTRLPLTSERVISPPAMPDMGFSYKFPPDLLNNFNLKDMSLPMEYSIQNNMWCV